MLIAEPAVDGVPAAELVDGVPAAEPLDGVLIAEPAADGVPLVAVLVPVAPPADGVRFIVPVGVVMAPAAPVAGVEAADGVPDASEVGLAAPAAPAGVVSGRIVA